MKINCIKRLVKISKSCCTTILCTRQHTSLTIFHPRARNTTRRLRLLCNKSLVIPLWRSTSPPGASKTAKRMRFTGQYYRSLISAAHHCFFPLTHISNFSKPLLLVPFSPGLTARFLHRQQTQSFSMASDNLAALSADDEQYGFRRPEMYQSNLAGTVDPYDRHVFLRYKSPESWASRVEASDSDPLPKLLASALKARKNDTTVKVGFGT